MLWRWEKSLHRFGRYVKIFPVATVSLSTGNCDIFPQQVLWIFTWEIHWVFNSVQQFFFLSPEKRSGMKWFCAWKVWIWNAVHCATVYGLVYNYLRIIITYNNNCYYYSHLFSMSGRVALLVNLLRQLAQSPAPQAVCQWKKKIKKLLNELYVTLQSYWWNNNTKKQ